MYGTFLRRIRESRGLSQQQLAEVAGLQQSNISALENDARLPSLATLNRIAGACGYELAAVAGHRTIRCPLPRVGWFPDEDQPRPEPGDPPDEPTTAPRTIPMAERVRILTGVLQAVDAAVRTRRR